MQSLLRQMRGDDKAADRYLAAMGRSRSEMLAEAERRLPGLSKLVVHRELSTPLSTAHFTGHPGQDYQCRCTAEPDMAGLLAAAEE